MTGGVHIHAWRASACSCGATRCTDRNRGDWRCTLHTNHTEAHHYADGTTSAVVALKL